MRCKEVIHPKKMVFELIEKHGFKKAKHIIFKYSAPTFAGPKGQIFKNRSQKYWLGVRSYFKHCTGENVESQQEKG